MADLREEVRRLSGERDAAGFDRFLAWLEELHDVEFDAFIDTNYDTLLDLVRSPLTAARLLRLGGSARSAPRSPRSSRTSGCTRSSASSRCTRRRPASARAVFAVITYMDTVRGVYYPEGGMHAVPVGMARALVDAGVPVHTGVEVAEVLRRGDGAVAGVAHRGRRAAQRRRRRRHPRPARRLRAAAARLPAPRTVRRGGYSPSAVVWHVGAQGAPGPEVRHHNIHFGQEWDGAFRALIDRQELMPDPSRLVTVPTVTDPSPLRRRVDALRAGAGAAHGSGLDWARESGPMRERLHAFLDADGYPTDVAEERLVTPDDWEAQGMHLGTPFALAHTFSQSGPFRPRNVDRRVPGLVFAGSGTTPGVGIPMVLVSGRLAAERVHEYAGTPARSTATPTGGR